MIAALAACAVLVVMFAWSRVQLRRERDARRRDEPLLLVGRLTAAFVHDMRNATMVLQGFGDLARKAASAPGTDPRLARLVGDLSDHTARVAADLQTYLQILLGNRAPAERCPLPEVLSTAVKLTQPVARHQERVLEFEEPSLPSLLVTESTMRSALLNLILNAIEHATSTVRVSATAAAEGVEIVVEDDGAGVPEHVTAKLFQPGASGRERTGLGLAAAHAAAVAHGGTLQYERRGAATRFVLRLPHEP